jgi:predicted nucleotidyltransferase
VADTYSYALDLRQQYSGRKITLLVQGSYANKTNIPSESDVDVAVILESTFTTQYRVGVSDSNYGFSEGTFSAAELKDEVENALNKYFRYKDVERLVLEEEEKSSLNTSPINTTINYSKKLEMDKTLGFARRSQGLNTFSELNNNSPQLGTSRNDYKIHSEDIMEIQIHLQHLHKQKEHSIEIIMLI